MLGLLEKAVCDFDRQSGKSTFISIDRKPSKLTSKILSESRRLFTSTCSFALAAAIAPLSLFPRKMKAINVILMVIDDLVRASHYGD